MTCKSLSLLAAGALLASTVALPAQQAAETRPPNAPAQTPALEGQTRAPKPAALPRLAATPVAQGLPKLWAMEFLPDGRMIVTAKKGEIRIISSDGMGPAIAGVPKVDSAGQGGLLDIALAPDFASSGRIFFSYAEPRQGGNGTTVASARLVEDGRGGGALEDLRIVFRQMPTYDGDKHFGSRLVFAPDGTLFVTVGERSDQKVRGGAQDPMSGFGNIFRITAEGAPAPGNPFAADVALPEIWSLGHRNLQAAALDGQGRLWTVEHGPKGGDELNRPERGKNYGWPEVTYGLEYSGKPVGKGITQHANTQQPVYYWDPVIAPSGMAYYDAGLIPEWRGAFLVGGLVSQGIVILHMQDDRVAAEERLPLDARIRDVRVGPDGAVYAITETRGDGGSSILRIAPEVGG